MLVKFSSADYSKIETAISSAIASVLSRSGLNEPAIVAYLTWELPNAINKLGLSGISAGGVFVHQRPLVSYDKMPDPKHKSVELGDLLLVSTRVKKGKVDERRALLLQVKKVKDIFKHPDNLNQWRLYADWPSFHYACPPLKGKHRYITEPDMYDAAKYMLIVASSPNYGLCNYIPIRSPASCCNAVTAQPIWSPIGRYQCFVNEIMGLIVGNTGKTYLFPSPPGKQGWHRVIQDLIKKTGKLTSCYMEKASGGTMQKRANGAFLLTGFPSEHSMYSIFAEFCLHNNNNGEPPKDIGPWPSEPEENGAISVIEFVVDGD